MTTPPNSPLLSVSDLKGQYGLGRDLSRQLGTRLPHVYVGRRRLMVWRDDVERLLRRAAQEGLDLWTLARMDRDDLRRWLNGDDGGTL